LAKIRAELYTKSAAAEASPWLSRGEKST
jgi:hypothetical protein